MIPVIIMKLIGLIGKIEAGNPHIQWFYRDPPTPPRLRVAQHLRQLLQVAADLTGRDVASPSDGSPKHGGQNASKYVFLISYIYIYNLC